MHLNLLKFRAIVQLHAIYYRKMQSLSTKILFYTRASFVPRLMKTHLKVSVVPITILGSLSLIIAMNGK
jgi:hypothetical protein